MKKLALVTWWENKEREISLLSAKNVFENIDTTKFEVEVFDFPARKNDFIKNAQNFDIVLPFIHGVWWEDWVISAFCEFVGVECLFSSSQAHRLCLDKHLSNLFARNAGFDAPESYLVRSIEKLKNVNIKWKVFVKPCNGGSSVDNGVFENVFAWQELIEKILTYDEVIVQEFIQKEREFTVSIIGDYDKNPQVMAISEVLTNKEIFDYDAKYKAQGATEIVHAQLDESLKASITSTALKIYKMFQLKTFSRIDFLYANNKLYFLEVNTIPGFTKMSFVPQAILSSGKTIQEFLTEVIEKID